MRRLGLALVLAGMLVPATALARRHATRGEHSALVAAAVAAHDLDKAQGPCTRGWISTVNRNYAVLEFPPPKSRYCQREAANGVSLFHRARGHWRFITAGSDLRCPIRGIPTRVARDLKVC